MQHLALREQHGRGGSRPRVRLGRRAQHLRWWPLAHICPGEPGSCRAPALPQHHPHRLSFNQLRHKQTSRRPRSNQPRLVPKQRRVVGLLLTHASRGVVSDCEARSMFDLPHQYTASGDPKGNTSHTRFQSFESGVMHAPVFVLLLLLHGLAEHDEPLGGGGGA
jgi:hypothetical protein